MSAGACRSEEDTGSPAAEGQAGATQPGCGEMNSGPVGEQRVFLTVELGLQPGQV